jgi:hypothetical protein
MDWQRQLAEAQAEARVQNEANKVLTVNLDWLRVMVNQLEHERAMMVAAMGGPKIAPRVLRGPEETQEFKDPSHFDPFSDIGDAAAEKQGIGWNLDGTVAYKE